MSTDTAVPAEPAAPTASHADDLFTLARQAAAARDAAFGRRGTFVRTRQLLETGAWRGPRDAAESFVDEADLAALGGWPAAHAAGAGVLVCGRDPELAREAAAEGARIVWRLPFQDGESDAERLARLGALRSSDLPAWGALPTPVGEPYGLDTIRFVALCRLSLPPAWHLLADVTALGPRLAQMCFGFGADELRAPIVAERALRLGANAGNPALTRKEAVTLIRGAGLTAAERAADDTILEVT